MIDSPRLLAICASLKPAPGQAAPSACRELLKGATQCLSTVFADIDTLDLREAALPGFEGLLPDKHYLPAVREAHAVVSGAAGLILSVPAYWGGIGSCFKTFVELMCGPSYDAAARSPFHGKPVVALLIGSDAHSAREGASQLDVILATIGARQVAPAVVVDDPAVPGAADAALQALVGSAALLARSVVREGDIA